MELTYGHPKSLKPIQTKYCPGCGHGVIHRLITEVIDEMGIQTKSIILNPVGCSIWASLYFDFDSVQVPHGRTPAGATGVKRMKPDHLVICYQGDGDLAAIGTAEMVHAANRGEKFTTIFVNNAIYGMTGGQMAPTTLVEILSQCPTNWAMNPVESVEWLEQNMIPFYQLGELKNELSTAQGGAK